MKKVKWFSLMTLTWLMMQQPVQAASINVQLGDGSSPEGLSSTLQILIFMTFLTFLPAIVLTMTSFTRITIVFSMLRNGMGTQTTPPNQVLVGLALFLTFFIMSPVVSEIKTNAIDPYISGEIKEEVFLKEAKAPLQNFMLTHTRAKDLELFVDISGIDVPENTDDLPFTVVVPSFIISELKTAFEVSFLLFLPFVVIDFIVSSCLMSMGMVMLPPVMISLPVKILIFMIMDGWHLVVKTLVEGFM